MRRFSTRTWMAAGSALILALVVGTFAALSSGPKDDVLGVEYERSSTTAPTTTAVPVAGPSPTTTAAPVASSPSPPAGSSPSTPAAQSGSITGTVTRGGAPLGGAQIKLTLAGGGERTTVTSGDGRYALGGVPAGRHQLQVIDPGDGSSCDADGNCLGAPSQTANRQVDVSAGRESRVDVAFT